MISVIIHTKNSHKTLQRALDSVAWADERVVVDMESSDNTLDIAKKNKCTILKHKDVGYVEPARNAGIAKAKGPWILILDADEEIPATLGNKLQSISKLKQEAAYSLPRKNIVFGQPLTGGGWWPDYNVRFFAKGTVTWKKKIHSQPDITGSHEYFEARDELAIMHHHYETVEDYISRLNRYTTIEAKSIQHPKSNPVSVFFDDFFRRYYRQQGYIDGEIGITLSILQSMYQVVTHAKSMKSPAANNQIDHQTVDALIKSWRYWDATKQIETVDSNVSKLFWRLRRWLRI